MLRLMHPDGAVEWRYIPIFNYKLGDEIIFDAAVVADQAHDTALFAVTIAGRLDISDDGGASWTALGTDLPNGFDLGAFTTGERKPYKLRYQTLADIREELIGFRIGEGT